MEPSLPPEPPVRPWAQGIGLLVLGLVVATFANVLGLSGENGLAARAAGVVGYAGGLLLAAMGVHRVLWFGSARPRWVRYLVTAVVTPPVFAGSGIVLGALLTLFQMRFAAS